MNNYNGEKFINNLYKNLQHSKIVQRTALKSDNKNEKVRKYLERLERAHNGKHQEYLKELYYDNYVIKKENISKNYIKFLDEIHFNTYGEHIPKELVNEKIEHLIEDQKKSLDVWIDYLYSPDASFFPLWAKYWAFQGMINIGNYDENNRIYNKRSKTTTAPFIELDREVLAKCIDTAVKYVSKEKLALDLEEIIKNGSFSKLYTIFLKENRKNLYDNKEIEGKWIKYEQGDNYQPLLESLQGYNTGWCTAGEETCKNQLENGDFYIFYTKDKDNKYKIPRLAIRMDGTVNIAEIRGIAKDQNVEPHLEEILDKKLNEFIDKDRYKNRINCTKMLTYIYTKYVNKKEITIADLRFLYEIDEKIESFGWSKDPRIKEILEGRDRIKDLMKIFDCKKEEISFTKTEALRGNVKFHDGDLDFRNIEEIKRFISPEIINGNLILKNLTSIDNIKLPKQIFGKLDLRNIKEVENVKFPEVVRGLINLSNLKKAKNVVFPKQVETLGLNSLEEIENVILPEKVNGDLFLSKLTNLNGVKLPKEVIGSLYLDELSVKEGIELPEKIGGTIVLRKVDNLEGVKLPERVNGDLVLPGLLTANNIKWPKYVAWNLDLKSIKSPKGLKLPEKMDDESEISLDSLTTFEGLKLPKDFNGYLYLGGLTTIKGLELPKDYNLENLFCEQKLKEELIKNIKKNKR